MFVVLKRRSCGLLQFGIGMRCQVGYSCGNRWIGRNHLTEPPHCQKLHGRIIRLQFCEQKITVALQKRATSRPRAPARARVRGGAARVPA